MPLIVTPISTEEELQLSFALRFKVFVDEQGFASEEQIDEFDRQPNTYYFLGKDSEEDKIVATIRCAVFEKERKGKVGRVVVLPECRGKNYGLALMLACEDAMKDMCDKFVLSAQYTKIGFYEKCGYRRGDDVVYLEGGAPHVLMVKYRSPEQSD